MQAKGIGAFIGGVVVCGGILGGGFAFAGPVSAPLRKQVSVKIETISLSSNGTKTSNELVVVADDGQNATSTDSVTRDGVYIDQTAQVTPVINPNGSVTLVLSCQLTKRGSEEGSAQFKTTITVDKGYTKVIKGITRKTQSENNETMLLVTPSY